jgi:hypothetical protein
MRTEIRPDYTNDGLLYQKMLEKEILNTIILNQYTKRKRRNHNMKIWTTKDGGVEIFLTGEGTYTAEDLYNNHLGDLQLELESLSLADISQAVTDLAKYDDKYVNKILGYVGEYHDKTLIAKRKKYKEDTSFEKLTDICELYIKTLRKADDINTKYEGVWDSWPLISMADFTVLLKEIGYFKKENE